MHAQAFQKSSNGFIFLVSFLCVVGCTITPGQKSASISEKEVLSTPTSAESSDSSLYVFKKLSDLDWQQLFYDPCTLDWQNQWFLDGTKARISHGDQGMEFWAGPEWRNDEHHAVLWTKDIFEGDVRIDYSYTKLDNKDEAVNIIYILASGSGAAGFEEDIFEWAEKRTTPSMSMYFRHMNTLHISYAAFDVRKEGEPKVSQADYIRARRYLPEREKGLQGTALTPDYADTGLFQQGQSYQITIIKKSSDLLMSIKDRDEQYLCHWKIDNVPAVISGRIGLRHMWTRGARYKDIRVYQLE